jgi:hypothetical protein
MLAGGTDPLTDGAEETSSGTNSEDDEEGSDVHKMAKINHALNTLKQPVTIILRGQYEWQESWEEVVYEDVVSGGVMPEDIAGPLQEIYTKIRSHFRFQCRA